MPATDDEIREKYLERAIRELNHFTRDLQGCTACPRGSLMPVLGSGHPQADVFLLKYAPTASEIEEGVAFYGRSGTALMKSLKRLDIDPLAVYGTLCVKCPVADTALAAPECVARLVEEIAIVQPQDRRGDGPGGARDAQRPRAPARPGGRARPGEVQTLTPSIEALYVPGHRRGARRGGGQARVLDRVPGARRGGRTSRHALRKGEFGRVRLAGGGRGSGVDAVRQGCGGALSGGRSRWTARRSTSTPGRSAADRAQRRRQDDASSTASAGLADPDEGSIAFEGDDLLRRDAHEIAPLGIARTFQNLGSPPR